MGRGWRERGARVAGWIQASLGELLCQGRGKEAHADLLSPPTPRPQVRMPRVKRGCVHVTPVSSTARMSSGLLTGLAPEPRGRGHRVHHVYPSVSAKPLPPPWNAGQTDKEACHQQAKPLRGLEAWQVG